MTHLTALPVEILSHIVSRHSRLKSILMLSQTCHLLRQIAYTELKRREIMEHNPKLRLIYSPSHILAIYNLVTEHQLFMKFFENFHNICPVCIDTIKVFVHPTLNPVMICKHCVANDPGSRVVRLSEISHANRFLALEIKRHPDYSSKGKTFNTFVSKRSVDFWILEADMRRITIELYGTGDMSISKHIARVNHALASRKRKLRSDLGDNIIRILRDYNYSPNELSFLTKTSMWSDQLPDFYGNVLCDALIKQNGNTAEFIKACRTCLDTCRSNAHEYWILDRRIRECLYSRFNSKETVDHFLKSTLWLEYVNPYTYTVHKFDSRGLPKYPPRAFKDILDTCIMYLTVSRASQLVTCTSKWVIPAPV
jgi:hypothetical protein